jgi:hypothetical protein
VGYRDRGADRSLVRMPVIAAVVTAMAVRPRLHAEQHNSMAG